MLQNMSTFLVPAVLGLLALTAIVGVLSLLRNYRRIPPNLAGIVSGRSCQVKDETGKVLRTRGFRIVKGGATLVWPFFEEIEWLELNVVQLEVNVDESYSQDGVPINVEALANVKIAGDDASLEVAAEQFGSMKEDERSSMSIFPYPASTV